MAQKVDIAAIKQRFGIVGNSPLLNAAIDTATRVAGTQLSVLIMGESGVGKESFSKIIHALSPRKHNAFIAVNCGAIPEGTINSELFGHEKGSFTGSVGERKGYFETVNNGTIFLDEIGEMPLDTQAFLLRILENGEFLRVGSSQVQKTDVRVVAATNVNLELQVRKGKFREDLYYRLNQVPIRVPALKDRRDDIFRLFKRFALDFAERNRMDPVDLDGEARLVIENYAWQGNIRELKNAVEQLSIMSDQRLLGPEELLRVLPHLNNRNLPSLANAFIHSERGGDMSEREILYKLLFDMKNDLNDLKSFIFELISVNKLNVNTQRMQQSGIFQPMGNRVVEDASSYSTAPVTMHVNRNENEENNNPSFVLETPNKQHTAHEIVDESLSLDEMEKQLIIRALKKHNNRRKDAAQDLGFSERTLYRKIKMYDLD